MIQAPYCPAITLVGETSVSGSLQAMDCHINAAVQTGYDRLFGTGGAFGFALQSLLIIYVALMAFGFLTGRTRLTLTMMSPRVMTMVLVLTFVTFWPAYHAIFYGLLMGGPDEIAAALLGEKGSAIMHFAQALDGLFVKFADIARVLESGNANTGPVMDETAPVAIFNSHSMPVTLFWLSGLFLLVTTLGVLILTRLTLYLLLILGPIFIVLGLFPQTRGLFNGWLRTSLVFALAPLLTVLGGTAALMLFVPLIEAIGNDPKGAVTAVQPMVILFMGSVIYGAFLFVLMWVAASLVRDWQATWRDKSDARGGGGTAMSSITPIYPVPAQAALPALTFNGASGVSDAYARTEPLVAAVSRDTVTNTSSGGGGRAGGLGLYDPQARAPGQGSADRFSRVQGLGQRFRPATPPLSTPAPARPPASSS